LWHSHGMRGQRCWPALRAGPGRCQVARFHFLRFVDGVRHAGCILSRGGRTD
jgi:hypothetical protein